MFIFTEQNIEEYPNINPADKSLKNMEKFNIWEQNYTHRMNEEIKILLNSVNTFSDSFRVFYLTVCYL
jgi:hypothetical protein